MTMSRPPDEADGLVLVRLSDVPVEKRRVVAQRVIRVEGLVGVPALDLLLAAENPRQNPELLVRPDLARRWLR